MIPPVKVDGSEKITFKTATNALRRGVHFFSALQASDGHWPAENAGPLFFLPPLVRVLFAVSKSSYRRIKKFNFAVGRNENLTVSTNKFGFVI